MIYEAEDIDLAPAQRVPRQFRQLRHCAFGATVRRLRLDRHLTRAELGGLIGSTAAYVEAVEDHGLMPCLDTVFVLADALDTGASELLHDVELEAETRLLDRLAARLSDRDGPAPAIPRPRSA